MNHRITALRAGPVMTKQSATALRYAPCGLQQMKSPARQIIIDSYRA
jgi:hypothetical protein